MKSSTKIRAFFLLSVALGCFLAGMRSAFLFSDFSFEKQHFLTPQYEVILLFGILLSFLLLAVLAHASDRELPPPEISKPVEAAVHLPVILLHAALVTYDMIAGGEDTPLERIFLLCSHILFAASAVCGILSLGRFFERVEARLVTRAIPALGASFYAMYLYFESSTFMNNPNLLLLQAAFLLLSIYEVTLGRAELLGRFCRRFLFMSGATAALLIMTSLPSLLYTIFFGKALVTGVLPDLLLLFSAVRILALLFPAMFPREGAAEDDGEDDAEAANISESETEA